MQQAVLDNIEVLTADQTNRICELVSNAIKSLVNVPLNLVEEDLLKIIGSSPVQGALLAISRCACAGDTVSKRATMSRRFPIS